VAVRDKEFAVTDGKNYEDRVYESHLVLSVRVEALRQADPPHRDIFVSEKYPLSEINSVGRDESA
jgi:hypothetical protein